MSIFENTILVERKISAANTIGRICCIALIAVFLILSFTPVAPLLFVIPAILVAVVFYFLHMETQVEYEYTYIEGRLSFAKITAKRKRKELAEVDMENLLLLAPADAPELMTYHSGSKKAAAADYTSGKGAQDVYEVVYKRGEDTAAIRFQPDANMLALIQKGNMQQVIVRR